MRFHIAERPCANPSRPQLRLAAETSQSTRPTLTVQRSALGGLVDILFRATQGEPYEVWRIGRLGLEGCAVCRVMSRREHRLDIDRPGQISLDGLSVRSLKRRDVGGKDQHRLAEQPPMLASKRILIRLPHRLGCRGDDSCGQKGCDIQLLPDRQIVQYQNGYLGIEEHRGCPLQLLNGHYSRPCGSCLEHPCIGRGTPRA